MTEHDFKGALETWEGIQEPIEYSLECRIEDVCNNMPVTEMKNAIQFALKLAHAVQSGEVDIPDTWPESGWNKNAAAFVDLIQATGGFWCMDMDLKYLNIRIDTRSGHFVILKNERSKDIDTDRVLRAMRKWVDECGFNTENPRAISPKLMEKISDD